MGTVQLLHADVIEGLRSLKDASVHCIVTSPPYLALRRYAGVTPRTWSDGSSCVLGEEPTLHVYVQHMVEVFAELKRVLHPSGTFWLNIGDSYQHGGPQPSTGIHARNGVPLPSDYKRGKTFKSKKQLGMVPARVAIALQEDGWILRQDIIWAKGLSFCPTYSGSVMPESITDRAIWAHEHLFHFALNDKYFYDMEACREPYADSTRSQAGAAYKGKATKDYDAAGAQNPSDVKRRILEGIRARVRLDRDQVGSPSQMRSLVADEGDRYMSGRVHNPTGAGGRNLRNVWVVPKEPLKEAHFAAFPTKLVEPVIKLGTSDHGVCPSCLSPWERVTTREPVPSEVQEAFERARMRTIGDTGRSDGHTARKPNYRRKILGEGWRPTCACEENDPIPATVLDPFSGSGRAGVVACRLGRSYIGIDASADYIEIARRLIGAELMKDEPRFMGDWVGVETVAHKDENAPETI